MAFYETIFIARQELSPAQVETLAEEITAVIKDNGGSIAKTEFCGLRSLAYAIRKNKKGHYVLFNLEVPAKAIEEMERHMRLSEDILRFLTISIDAIDEEPSVLMQSRSKRSDRPSDNNFSGADA